MLPRFFEDLLQSKDLVCCCISDENRTGYPPVLNHYFSALPFEAFGIYFSWQTMEWYPSVVRTLLAISFLHWCRFWGGRHPFGSDTKGGKICLAPSVFWQVIPTWQQEIWTEIEPECGKDLFLFFGHHLNLGSKFWSEIEPVCSKDLFFGLHLSLGANFQTEIELLSLTKLCKNILPPQNLLNQLKIDAYAFHEYRNKSHLLAKLSCNLTHCH